jgi:hypothetical protein
MRFSAAPPVQPSAQAQLRGPQFAALAWSCGFAGGD